MERFGAVREYAGRVDFLYVLHRQLDRVAQAIAELQGDAPIAFFSFSLDRILRLANSVEALCNILPRQLREECGCEKVEEALWLLRQLGDAERKHEEGERCSEVLDLDEELREVRERLLREKGKAARQPQAAQRAPAPAVSPALRAWLNPPPTSLVESVERLLERVEAMAPEEALRAVEMVLQSKEWAERVEKCREWEERVEGLRRKAAELLRSAGLELPQGIEDESAVWVMVVVSRALCRRVVDVLDAHQLLIPGRRVAVGVARGEAGRADRVGVEE